MIKAAFSLLLILITFCSALGQSVEVDSLYALLAKKSNAVEKNEVYLKLLNPKYCRQYTDGDQLVKRALANAQSISNSTNEDKAYFYETISVFYGNRREIEKSNSYADLALELVEPNSEIFNSVLYTKAKNYKNSGAFNKCIATCLQAENYLKSTELLSLRCNVLGILASAYRDKGQNEDALMVLKKSLRICQNTTMERTIHLTLTGIGRVYQNMAMYDSAFNYHLQAKEHGILAMDDEYVSIAYNNMGNVLETKGDYKGGLEFYIKSLELKEKIGDNASLAVAYHNIGSIKLSMKKYDEAKESFLKSIGKARAAGAQVVIIHNTLKLGKVMALQGQVDSAIFYHTKSLEMSQKSDFNNGIIESHLSLGKDYWSENLLRTSYNHYDNALTLARKSKRYSDESAALIGIAKVYLASTKIDNPNRDVLIGKAEAELLLKKAYSASVRQNNMRNIVTCLDALRTLYANNGDNANHALYAEKYIHYRDSLYNVQNADAIAMWETKYETAEKDKEIELLEKDALLKDAQAKRRRLLAIAFGILAVVIGVIGFSFYNQLKLRQKLRMERFRNKVAADLHDDVGSTLSSIAMYSEVIKQKAVTKLPEALPMLENMTNSSKELMDAMSDIVWTINPKNNSLHSLLTRIKHFTSELCEAKDIVFYYEQSGEVEGLKIDMEAAQNVFLVLKEGVNNALKYSECTELKMSIAKDKNSFSFELKDNGKGFDTTNESLGNGMRTMRERMTEVGGTYQVKSSESGTAISGNLPV